MTDDRERDFSALRAQPQTAELPHQASPSATHVLPWRWQHDALVTADGRIVLHVHAESACGRADDDYYSCRPPSPTVTLYCTPEHREFIRRACNAHDRLVAALKIVQSSGGNSARTGSGGDVVIARSAWDAVLVALFHAGALPAGAVLAQTAASPAEEEQTPDTRGEADPSNPRP